MKQIREGQYLHYLFLAERYEANGAESTRLGATERTALTDLEKGFCGYFDVPPEVPLWSIAPARNGRPSRLPHWREASPGKPSCYVYAEERQDVLLLQRGAGQRNLSELGSWQHLRQPVAELPAAVRGSSFFLGELLIYAGRVPGVTDYANVAGSGRELAGELLKSDPGETTPDVQGVSCPGYGWLFHRVDLPDRSVLLFADSDDGERAAGIFLNKVVPELGTSLSKIASYYRRYLAVLRESIHQCERCLTVALKEVRDQASCHPDDLDRQLAEVSRTYGDFAAALASFKDKLNTVAINAANLRECLDRHQLPQDGLPAAWRAAARQGEEQFAADDRYYEATAREAEITLRVLQARAQIERSKVEREENRVLSRIMLVVAVAGAIVSLASDELAKALANWWHPRPPSDPFSFGELLIAKLGLAAMATLGPLVWWLYRFLPKNTDTASADCKSIATHRTAVPGRLTKGADAGSSRI